MLAAAESDGVVTLVRRIVSLQAVNNSLLSCFVDFLGEPEHTGGRLLDEDSGNLAFCGGDLEGGLVADVDLLQEFNFAGSLVDQHEADVGGIAGVELDGDFGNFRLRGVNGRNLNGLFLLYAVFILVVQVGVAVCGKIGIVYEAFFCGVHSDFVLQGVGVGAEHCAVLHVPGQLVDVAALVAFDISTACCVVSGIDQFHNNRNFLCGGTVFGDLPTISSGPDGLTGGVVNDLQGSSVQIDPLGHVVSDDNIIEGGLSQVGQGTLQSLAQTCDAVGLNEGRLFAGDAGVHPGGVTVIVHNIHCGDFLHSGQSIGGCGSTGPAVTVGNVSTLVGGVVEQILNVGAVLLVVLNKGTLCIGYGVLDTGDQTGVCINFCPNFISKSEQFVLGNSIKSCIDELLGGVALETITENFGVSSGEFACVSGATEGFLCDSLSTELGPGLPVEVEVSGSLVGIQIAVGDEDYIDFVQSFVVICDVLSNAGKAGFAVGGGAAVQQVTGQFAQSGCQFVSIFNMNQDFVIAHTEGHQGQLSIAAAVQNSLTDGGNGFLHGRPFVVHGVRAVNHQDDFVVTLVAVFAGNSDLNLKTVGVAVDQLIGLVGGGVGSDGIVGGRRSGNQGVLHIKGGFNSLGDIDLDAAFCHADEGLGTIDTLFGGENVCVLGQILLTNNVQGEGEGLCLAQLQTVDGIETIIVCLGCIFTGQRKCDGLLCAVSIQIFQDYVQIVLFTGNSGQGELQVCFVSVSSKLLAHGQGHIFSKGLVVDDNGLDLGGLSHQVLVERAGSGCAFGIVLAVQAIAHGRACCGQVAHNHAVNTVHGCLRAVGPGPDGGLHSVQCFTFGHSVNNFISQLNIHRGDIPIDIAAVVVFACGKLIAGGELLSLHLLDGVFVLYGTGGNSCLQGCLQACQAAGALCSAPVTVEHDTTDMLFCFFGSVVFIIFQVCQSIPGGALSAGCQVDAVTIVRLACFVHQQELLGTGAGGIVVRAVNIGGQLGAVMQGSAAGSVLQFLDYIVAVGIFDSIACCVTCIHDLNMADIVAAVVAVADILEGITFRCVGNGDGGRIVEVTVVGIQFTGYLLRLLVSGAVTVKLQSRLDGGKFFCSLLGGGLHRGGCSRNFAEDTVFSYGIGSFSTGDQINGDLRRGFCSFGAYAHKHGAHQHNHHEEQGKCFGECFLHV